MSVMNRRILVLPLALAGGITWGLGMSLLSLWVMLSGHGTKILNVLSDAYPYYDASLPGCFSGLLCGFIDMFSGLFIFAFLYNLFAPEYLDTRATPS